MKNLLLNQMESKGIKSSDIERATGVSNAQISLAKNLKRPIELTSLLKIVREVIPEYEKEYMSNYITHMNLKTPEKVLEAIEYTSTNRMFDEFSYLLNTLENGSKVCKQWAEVYKLVLQFQTHDYDEYDFRMSIRKLFGKDDLQNVMLNLLDSYCLFKMQEYKSIESVLSNAFNDLNKEKESYLIESFKVRVAQVMCQITLKVNCDKDRSRKFADNLIESNIGIDYQAYGEFVKGSSYIPEDYQKAYSHLKEAELLYKKLNKISDVKVCRKRLNLLNIYWYQKHLNDDFEKYASENTPDGSFIIGHIRKDFSLIKKALKSYRQSNDNFMTEISLTYLENENVRVGYRDVI